MTGWGCFKFPWSLSSISDALRGVLPPPETYFELRFFLLRALPARFSLLAEPLLCGFFGKGDSLAGVFKKVAFLLFGNCALFGDLGFSGEPSCPL